LKTKLITIIIALVITLSVITGCTTTAEPIDLSDNVGYLSFDPELSYIPTMPNGWVDRETVKEAVLDTFIITDTTVLDLTKPYYRPFTLEAYHGVGEISQAKYNGYCYPFYACDDYTQAVWGLFNANPEWANMPIFFAHILRASGSPHAILITYYNGDIYYIECTCWYGGWTVPHDTYELVLLVG